MTVRSIYLFLDTYTWRGPAQHFWCKAEWRLIGNPGFFDSFNRWPAPLLGNLFLNDLRMFDGESEALMSSVGAGLVSDKCRSTILISWEMSSPFSPSHPPCCDPWPDMRAKVETVRSLHSWRQSNYDRSVFHSRKRRKGRQAGISECELRYRDDWKNLNWILTLRSLVYLQLNFEWSTCGCLWEGVRWYWHSNALRRYS